VLKRIIGGFSSTLGAGLLTIENYKRRSKFGTLVKLTQGYKRE